MRDSAPARPWRKAAIAIGGAMLFALLSVGAYLGGLQLTDNFHPVIAGEFYRSAQPTAEDIAAYARQYGIKAIINLRGTHVGASWYDAEVAAARRLNIKHIDFGMSSSRELTRAQALALIALMKDAPKPLLVHCKFGADRSGLASALYLAAVARAGEARAESQLNIRYGHLCLPFRPECAMDRTFEALEPSLGFPNS